MQDFREIFDFFSFGKQFIYFSKCYERQSKLDSMLCSARETLACGLCLMQMGAAKDCSHIKWVEDGNL